MEIRSASPFNAIPSLVIRGVFLFTFLTLKLAILYCTVFYVFVMFIIIILNIF